MSKSKYSVQILVDGKPVKEYTKDNKTFIEAKSGTEYTVRVKNNSASRAVAIVSIDGVNTITGEIAKPDSTGYVIQAFNSIEVKGYRQDQSGGGRFKFTEKESGYSKEIDGTGINSGVIGVYLVAEQSRPENYIDKIGRLIKTENGKEEEPNYTWPPYRPIRPNKYEPHWTTTSAGGYAGLADRGSTTCKGGDLLRSVGNSSYNAPDNINNAPIMQNYCAVVGSSNFVDPTPAEAPAFDRATTWGTKFEEAVEYVEFTRSNQSETLNVYYASRDSLKKQGIINDNPPQVSFPQSFPTFAKPPAGWKS